MVCLVKIFWNITRQNKRFINLATVKNDKLIWEESITVNTLIFQAVLDTDRMFFSLDDLVSFCEATKHDEWCETMKRSFHDLATAHDALSAVPTFHERIEFLKTKATNVFLIADKILLATKKEKELVLQIKDLVKQHYDAYTASIGGKGKSEREVKDKVELSFMIKLAMVPDIGTFRPHADAFLKIELSKIDLSNYVPEESIKNVQEIAARADDANAEEDFKDILEAFEDETKDDPEDLEESEDNSDPDDAEDVDESADFGGLKEIFENLRKKSTDGNINETES